MAQTYEIGTKAWQPDSTEGWVASAVESRTVDGDNVVLVFKLDNGEVCIAIDARLQQHGRLADEAHQTRTVETTLDALQDDSINTTLPPLMNPAVLEASDDLTNLSHLNEPAGKLYQRTSSFSA